jgi:hypothetical protein
LTVKIFDLELSNDRFALRVFAAFVFAGLIAFFYYYLTMHVGSLISGYVAESYALRIQNIFAAFGPVGIFQYLIPIFIVSVFFATILKGSWGYGILLVIEGVLYGIYYLYLYETGILFTGLPAGTTSNVQIDPTVLTDIGYFLDLITIVFIILTVESIVRGTIIIARRPHQG